MRNWELNEKAEVEIVLQKMEKQQARNQYFEKMALINSLDPYEVPNKQRTSNPNIFSC